MIIPGNQKHRGLRSIARRSTSIVSGILGVLRYQNREIACDDRRIGIARSPREIGFIKPTPVQVDRRSAINIDDCAIRIGNHANSITAGSGRGRRKGRQDEVA